MNASSNRDSIGIPIVIRIVIWSFRIIAHSRTMNTPIGMYAKKILSTLNPISIDSYYFNEIQSQRNRTSNKPESNKPGSISRPMLIALYSYYLVLACRYFLTGLTVRNDANDRAYFDFDIVMSAVAQRTGFDSIAFMLLSLMVLYGIAIHRITSALIDQPIAAAYHSLIVRNLEQFQQQNYAKFGSIQFRTSNMFGTWLRLLRVTFDIAVHRYRDKRGLRRLKYFPLASVDIRVRTLIRFFVAEMMNIFFTVNLRLVSLLAVAAYAAKYIVRNTNNYSAPQRIIFVLDRLMVMTLNVVTIRSALCELYRLMINSFVYTSMFKLLDRRLATFVRFAEKPITFPAITDTTLNTRQRRISRVSPLAPAIDPAPALALDQKAAAAAAREREAKKRCNTIGDCQKLAQLRHITLHHHALMCAIDYLNRRLVSWEMCAFIFTQIPYNVYLVTKLVLGSSSELTVAIIAAVQMFILLSGAMPTARVSAAIHASAGKLASIQATLRTPAPHRDCAFAPLITKMKLANFYEKININTRIGFSCGAIGTVSWDTVFHFTMIYAAYVIYASALIKKTQKTMDF